MLSRGNAAFLVAAHANTVLAYSIVLFHKGTSLARVYSMAVDAAHRRTGIGTALMQAAETKAKSNNCLYTRLEVRRDNAPALKFYTNLGYEIFDIWPKYYEDATDALRFEKRVHIDAPSNTRKVPFYRQSTDFTCGPACLMMALSVVQAKYRCSPSEELQIWREATTIFMTSGHGGCGPHGLALAAKCRGAKPEIYLSRQGVLFLDGVRSEAKKEILNRVHADFKSRVKSAGIPCHRKGLTPQILREVIESGGIALVLISSYRLYGEKSPHWVVVTGIDDIFVCFHDPSVDEALHESDTDRMNVPIRLNDFFKMAQFGRDQLKAAVVISRK